MTTDTTTRPVSVEELRRAWHAVQDGQFRTGPGHPAPPRSGTSDAATPVWAPAEPVLPVVGCIGQAGATTLAVALATVAGPSRVIECASAPVTGLGAAAAAELGRSRNDWLIGRRQHVGLARASRVLAGPDATPVPDAPPGRLGLTVLDVGWEVAQLMASTGWIRHHVMTAPWAVVVTAPTVPGLRRLETTMTLLAPSRAVVAVIGDRPARWPRLLRAGFGPLTAAAVADDRIIPLPLDRGLALRGLDSAALPAALLKAASTLLQRTAVEDTHQEGHHE